LQAMECVVMQDLFLNETANYAHVFLPGSTFLEKDGTFINAERRIQLVRKVMEPKNGMADWEITCALSNALGYPMHYNHPSEIMDEIARLTPTFAGVSFEKLEELGSIQWPCNEKAPTGTPVMHIGSFVRGKGNFVITEYLPTAERVGPRYPLLLTTGRILSQYNVGAQTRRTENVVWHDEDLLEIHPHDAEERGIADGSWVKLASRAGETTLRAQITDRVAPGVVYTTFHHPDTQANVVTTDYSDWADQLPRIQVHGGAGVAVQRPHRLAGRLQRILQTEPPYRDQRSGGMAACGKLFSQHRNRNGWDTRQTPPTNWSPWRTRSGRSSPPSPRSTCRRRSPIICGNSGTPGCATRSQLT